MRTALLAALLSGAPAFGAGAQALPFAPGEHITYQARVGRLGTIGRATMTADGPVAIRGRPTVHLRFEIDTRVGPVRVLNVSDSWLDAAAMTALRFQKRERHPLSSRGERVEIHPDEHRWERDEREAGRTMSDAPLDELSFIYFLRTVPLETGGAMRYDRHFESSRNPTLVKVVGRETLASPGGTFPTVVVEMQVRDDRVKGTSAIRLHFTDDERRIPVRIESSVPMAGRIVLLLESFTAGRHEAAPGR